jgi:hypothetical protein
MKLVDFLRESMTVLKMGEVEDSSDMGMGDVLAGMTQAGNLLEMDFGEEPAAKPRTFDAFDSDENEPPEEDMLNVEALAEGEPPSVDGQPLPELPSAGRAHPSPPAHQARQQASPSAQAEAQEEEDEEDYQEGDLDADELMATLPEAPEGAMGIFPGSNLHSSPRRPSVEAALDEETGMDEEAEDYQAQQAHQQEARTLQCVTLADGRQLEVGISPHAGGMAVRLTCFENAQADAPRGEPLMVPISNVRALLRALREASSEYDDGGNASRFL